MAGKCLHKLPHSCGTSDALQLFENPDGSITGYCFACDTYINSSEIDGNIISNTSINNYYIHGNSMNIDNNKIKYDDIPTRKLLRETCQYYNVSLYENDSGTYILFPYTYNNIIINRKIRNLNKKEFFWETRTDHLLDLFGWTEATKTGSSKLFITEGELDALALFQALKNKQKGTKWEHLNPAVVSLINGAGSAKNFISKNAAKILSHFKEVILVFDNDEPGKKATAEVLQILPQAVSVQLPDKDPNECLIQGKELALANACLFHATKPKNTRVINANTLFEKARAAPQWGLDWPWKALTSLTRGIRMGETYYFGAGVKMGKSEIVNTLAVHLMLAHNLKVFLAKPEESNIKTVKLVLGKAVGKFFHDPKRGVDFDAYDEAAKRVSDRLYLLDLYQHVGWNTLRSDIISAVEEGAKAVFIDPITNLTNTVNAAEGNSLLQEFSQELAAMSKDLDFAAFLFCHLKAPETGPPHEKGGKVFSAQFAGSRAMMRSCNYMFGLEGNKDPDAPIEERNTRKLIILEDREFGEVGTIPLYWDHNTGLFNEMES